MHNTLINRFSSMVGVFHIAALRRISWPTELKASKAGSSGADSEIKASKAGSSGADSEMSSRNTASFGDRKYDTMLDFSRKVPPIKLTYRLKCRTTATRR